MSKLSRVLNVIYDISKHPILARKLLEDGGNL